ncbi:SDR family oxidoreductase [Streptomyces sp. NPDC004232]|uniref:SDR family NAD(P)-dependent oxidoreductase n=1 Tax=Streptomyces sp. NPDC004232 TaxID=3154454 RepID=UPI0033A1C83F
MDEDQDLRRQRDRPCTHRPRRPASSAGERRGSIVNCSFGTAVSGGDRKRPACSASKSDINALTCNIAGNWGNVGLRRNGVMPGLVMGEIQEQQNDVDLQKMFLSRVPTTRLGRPADLASVVTFLLSDDAGWINGQVWAIDGGASMRA